MHNTMVSCVTGRTTRSPARALGGMAIYINKSQEQQTGNGNGDVRLCACQLIS
jgi:hypothetical protein